MAPACELIEDIDAEDMTSGPEQKSKLSVVDVLENSEAERSWTGLITGKGSALMNGTKAGRSAGGVGGLDCRDSGVSGMVDGGNTGVGGIVRQGKGRSSFVEVAGFLFARVLAKISVSVALDFERDLEATGQRDGAD